PRFLQVPNLRRPSSGKKSASGDGEAGKTLASKLDLALATGNNSTLFDNSGGTGRVFSTGVLGLMLLTYQCFAPGGRIGVADWDGSMTEGAGSSEHAPCLNAGMLHAQLRGRSLLDSIHLNLMTRRQVAEFYGKERWGLPVWEQMPQKAGDRPAVENATQSYL